MSLSMLILHQHNVSLISLKNCKIGASIDTLENNNEHPRPIVSRRGSYLVSSMEITQKLGAYLLLTSSDFAWF